MCWDWQAIEDGIRAVAPVLTAGAACSGVYIGYRGLTKWRDETTGKRKIELAEDVLAGFYEACDIINMARSPMSFANEGSTRPKNENESEDDTRSLNAYFAVIERLDNKAAFFAEFYARRYRVLAVFGVEAARPYDDIHKIYREIIVAVRMLLSAHQRYRMRHRDEPDSLSESMEKWEGTIWGGLDDPIPERLDRIIEVIEATCRPVIQEAFQ